ncbi:MAG: hypothetical protein A2X28_10620 [Elusimicrobia bacterium GWA2_56_46]|nr:MAG: hypothetical protein A2X28_10620 [Elusimicrobia bacterium GWA2_56_46]OGR55094.1 MAG: hypothetical protein A2X39_09530 [Elusimicrobia bacterium GWC2_56_31]HBB66309.1 hypothetical protein [Elusimicrobiota bacterium]HBW23816.1 hypothetical protein [Elusimicrobiota bacterium]
MGKTKKCYNCSTEADENAKRCPRCNIKLGARTESGIAGKPGSLPLKILLIVLALALAGKIAGYSSSANSATAPAEVPAAADDVKTSAGVKDALIQKIKEKGSGSLNTLGVADIGYKGDALRVYVDERFNNLERAQQEQLVKIVANEWAKALGKDSTAVEIVEYGTDKTLDEWVLK